MGSDSPLPPEPRRRRRQPEPTRGDYRVYRAGSPEQAKPRRRPLPPREGRQPAPPAPPPPGRSRSPRPPKPPKPPRQRRRWSVGRVLKWVVLGVLGWTALAAVLFLFSAQFLQDRVPSSARAELATPGPPLVSATNTLILGSDLRAKGSKEPGAATSGPSRSDSIQVMRVGGGHSAKLSIPRDTVVDIPGYGPSKINAAYAIGGPALAIKTVSQYLGIPINHVILVNFEKFPQLVDAMGGVNYKGGCVKAKVNGGYANGGVTLDLPEGTTRLNGQQALALSRVRVNSCAPSENDLDRARRQQQLVSAMRSQVLSPRGFVRWPLIGWRAPQAISSDMGAAGLSGLMATVAVSGSGSSSILRPDGAVVLPDGGQALTVSEASKQRQVARFMSR
ncbi:MAG: LytR family transcriptional regulator [Solirubrobacteraceae bacterium]|nr:LytR family transcriptional regulator [Solirubrobacteraceae bacterium]